MENWRPNDFSNWIKNGCNKDDAGRVLTLDLGVLHEEIPNEIGLLVNLVDLFINVYGDKKINTNIVLPDTLINLQKLKKLVVYRVHMPLIPNVVYDLKSLEYLSLNGCNIVEISPKIKNLTNLKQFSFMKNQISTIPIELCELKSLSWIYHGDNPIDFLDPVVIAFLTDKVDASLYYL